MTWWAWLAVGVAAGALLATVARREAALYQRSRRARRRCRRAITIDFVGAKLGCPPHDWTDDMPPGHVGPGPGGTRCRRVPCAMNEYHRPLETAPTAARSALRRCNPDRGVHWYADAARPCECGATSSIAALARPSLGGDAA